MSRYVPFHIVSMVFGNGSAIRDFITNSLACIQYPRPRSHCPLLTRLLYYLFTDIAFNLSL